MVWGMQSQANTNGKAEQLDIASRKRTFWLLDLTHFIVAFEGLILDTDLPRGPEGQTV